MDLKAGVEVRWKLPRKVEEKGIPGEAKASGKGAEARIDTV